MDTPCISGWHSSAHRFSYWLLVDSVIEEEWRTFRYPHQRDSTVTAPLLFKKDACNCCNWGIIWYRIINGHFRNLNWRYLPYIRPSSGLCKGTSPISPIHMARNMVRLRTSIWVSWNSEKKTTTFTGWWFGTCFFHILGIVTPTDFHIFQRGIGQPPSSLQSTSW